MKIADVPVNRWLVMEALFNDDTQVYSVRELAEYLRAKGYPTKPDSIIKHFQAIDKIPFIKVKFGNVHANVYGSKKAIENVEKRIRGGK